jgi:hypothetical protein
MMAAFLSAFTGGWVPTELEFDSYSQIRGMFLVYGVGWLTVNGTLALLNGHALRRADSLGLNAVERFDTRTELQAWSLVGLFGAFSMAIALAVPDQRLGLAGHVYFGLMVVMPLHGRWRGRKRQSIGSP